MTANRLKSRRYLIKNEVWSAVTHGVGIALAITALVLLLVRAVPTGDWTRIWSFAGFGIALIVLYTSSTLFHALYFTRARKVFQALDHSSIYVLIAGSYLPYCLVAIGGPLGVGLLITIWALCLTGILLDCLAASKRLHKIEVAIYVLLGWLCLIAMVPLWEHLGVIGFWLLVAGGVAYTVGALIYTRRSIPYIHVVWHVFVMVGSALMFVSIYLFV
ncbi:PAQR family membrane homeostasis protein TrhA [Lacticaseibacillus thailandensis]|nr:hemolysin III family protein [Lacticaseibacillus thailandensis]